MDTFGLSEEFKRQLLSEKEAFQEETKKSPKGKGRPPKKKVDKKEKAFRERVNYSIRSILKQILTENENEEYYAITESLVEQAKLGNIRALELIVRLEEQDSDESNGPISININLKGGTDGVRGEE